jgi:hypothetical protein
VDWPEASGSGQAYRRNRDAGNRSVRHAHRQWRGREQQSRCWPERAGPERMQRQPPAADHRTYGRQDWPTGVGAPPSERSRPALAARPWGREPPAARTLAQRPSRWAAGPEPAGARAAGRPFQRAERRPRHGAVAANRGFAVQPARQAEGRSPGEPASAGRPKPAARSWRVPAAAVAAAEAATGHRAQPCPPRSGTGRYRGRSQPLTMCGRLRLRPSAGLRGRGHSGLLRHRRASPEG